MPTVPTPTYKAYRCGTCKTVWQVPQSTTRLATGTLAGYEKHTPNCPDRPREVAY